MNYYPHHIGDYKSATMHLSNEEDLAYRRLLEMYYDTEQPIPLETQWVARRLRVGTQALDSVLNDFFVKSESGWQQPKCDLVIREYHEMAEKNRRNGKLGGRPKTNKQAIKNPVGYQSDANGNPVVTHSKPNQEPKTKNQEPRDIYTPEFEEFWSWYPSKTGKGEAFRSWKKINPDVRLRAIITVAVGAYKLSKRVKEGFVKNPATWLNQRCWEDEFAEQQAEANKFAGDI
jgi:uncharacterized protein YdaU (DUF1376 family)